MLNTKISQGAVLMVISGALSMLLLSGCGGGGNDNTGGGSGSVQYTGNEQPAAIDNQNAASFTNQSFLGGDTASSVDVVAAQDVNANSSTSVVAGTLLSHTDTISRAVTQNPRAFSNLGNSPRAVVDVNVDSTCPNGGSVSFSGSVDTVTKLGSLNLIYSNCENDDVRINGSATLDINAYNADIDEHTDVELIFNNLRFVGLNPADNIDWQIGANLHAQAFYTSMLDPFTKRASIDMVLANNASGASLKIQDYVVEVSYDQYQVPASATATINGRIYHHQHGYVDIATTAPLQYAASEIDANARELIGYPHAGGPIIYTGAANRKIRVSPVDNVYVNVAADVDADGQYEWSVTVPWGSLKDDYVNENAPVANAGSDATITLGQSAQLDASGSSDADYNLIDFSWVVTDQPTGSDAGLVAADSLNPSITPDTLGSYTLEVTVNDGWFTDTDTVTINVDAAP